jgi:hypothetical protein
MSRRRLYLACEDGMYCADLKDGSTAKAELIGLNGMGRVRSIVIDGASPNRIYAATMEGGFWRSDDEGDNWRPINKNIVYLLRRMLKASSMPAPDQPRSIVARTAEKTGRICDRSRRCTR